MAAYRKLLPKKFGGANGNINDSNNSDDNDDDTGTNRHDDTICENMSYIDAATQSALNLMQSEHRIQ